MISDDECNADDASVDDCIHVSYTEQAGGFVICDHCGDDVTAEIFRARESTIGVR